MMKKEHEGTVRVKRLRDGARLPARATQGSAGYDLFADLSAPVTIPPGGVERIPTGIVLELPEDGHVAGLVFARSGLATKHGLVPANAVGVVDGDFRGEILVVLRNLSGEAYTVSPGDRVAQLLFVPVCLPQLCEAGDLTQTSRGDGGWGSTGH